MTVVAAFGVAHEEPRMISISDALISCVNHLTGLAWEGDPRTTHSDNPTTATSRALSGTPFFFHHFLLANHHQAPFDLK